MTITSHVQLKLEQALTGMASDWRGGAEIEREILGKQYCDLLNMMLDWGIEVDLDPDGELPDRIMPDRYLQAKGL